MRLRWSAVAAAVVLGGCAGARAPVVIDRPATERDGFSDTAVFLEQLVDTLSAEPQEIPEEPLPGIVEGEESATTWSPPDWMPVEAIEEAQPMSDDEMSATLSQLANSFRRGAYGGELLEDLGRIFKSSPRDSLRERAEWLLQQIEARDHQYLQEQLEGCRAALNQREYSEAIKRIEQLQRTVPHLQNNPEWKAAQQQLQELMERGVSSCSPAECRQLTNQAQQLLQKKEFTNAIQLARRASESTEVSDSERNSAWQLVVEAGSALCSTNRQQALAQLQKFRKSGAKEELIRGRSLLEECLELYGEVEEREKIERDINALLQMEKR